MMDASAPAIFIAIEQSGLGAAIRQASWIYPLANVGHIVGLIFFAAAVAILDLRLIGAFAATRPADIVPRARRAAVAAFALMLLTGLTLFIAEASHIVLNPVFQLKAALIAVALANALVLGRMAQREAELLPAHAPFPAYVRASAFASLSLWIAVAAAGRLIAYL